MVKMNIFVFMLEVLYCSNALYVEIGVMGIICIWKHSLGV